MSKRWMSLFFLLCWFPIVALTQSPVVEKSPHDDRDYGVTTLSNGLKVIVVSDKESPTAGAALVVRAGLYNDPKAFPGLAHFLEHMLFLGTERFPVPDEFQQFIQHNGGDRNAMTQGEKTSYFFSIHPEAFEPALERFADFFIAPSFNPEYVERELNAVDQEFELYAHKDDWALYEVNRETSNPQHPYHDHFGGNKETLGYDKPALNKALREFFNTHYHAKNMILALVGPQSKEELLAMAKHFEHVATRKEIVSQAARAPIYTEKETGLDIYIKSKGQYQELTLTFTLPREKNLLQRKINHLISDVLGYDGQGGLSHVLKEKEWIIHSQTSYSEISEEQDVLMLSFSLTDEGRQHIDEITRYAFTQINLLEKKGIPSYIVNETKTMNQLGFLYTEKDEATQLALGLANALYELPPEKLIKSLHLLPEDNVVKGSELSLLKQLTPQNMRRMIHSANEKSDTVSKWYKASYQVKRLSQREMKQLSSPVWMSGLAVQGKNQYVPAELNVKTKQEAKQIVPQKLKSEGITLWHYADQQFNVPKGTVYINFHFPELARTPERGLLANLYTKLVLESLRERFYSAAMAGSSISLNEHARGITLTVSGYSDKQDVLLKEIVSTLKAHSISRAQFEGMNDTVHRRLQNFEQKTAAEQAQTEFNTLLISPTYHPKEMVNVSQSLTFDKYKQFHRLFWNNCHVEMFVYGNYTAEQAHHFANIVQTTLKTNPKVVPSSQGLKMAQLKPGISYVREMKANDNHHVVLWYKQNEARDYPTLAKTILLSHLLEVPYYQHMRVDKQLAYGLGVHPYIVKKQSGLMLWIQSSRATPQALVDEMNIVFTHFQQDLKTLDAMAFEEVKAHLLMDLRQLPRTQDEQSHSWWATIENGDAAFHHKESIAQALEKITQDELVKYANLLFDPQSIAGQMWIVTAPLKMPMKVNSIASIRAFRENLPFVG